VSHSGGSPILFLPDRSKHPEIPSGWTHVSTDTGDYEANFVKVAVNVMRKPGSDANVLPSTLTEWFGPDAGRPGTNFRVAFEPDEGGYFMRPAGERPNSATGPELWRSYSREDIPGLFGLKFSTANWNAGFVPEDNQIFLLVTLEKEGLSDEHRYEDKFLGIDRFQWQSQNRTTQSSKHGQMLRYHVERGIPVHLFVRRSKKTNSRSSPFVYCGDVRFATWRGERPITFEWQLSSSVPERFQQLFSILTKPVEDRTQAG
jgi:hypothetical protein